MSTKPAKSACVSVLPSVGTALRGVVVTGATVDSDPDPDEFHALATIAEVSSVVRCCRSICAPGTGVLREHFCGTDSSSRRTDVDGPRAGEPTGRPPGGDGTVDRLSD